MLCDVCIGMLSQRKGLVMHGTLQPTFEHHKSTKTLRHSRDMQCPVCTRLAKTLSLHTDLAKDQGLSVQATLNRERGYGKETGKRCFKLIFFLHPNRECTFFLEETGK